MSEKESRKDTLESERMRLEVVYLLQSILEEVRTQARAAPAIETVEIFETAKKLGPSGEDAVQLFALIEDRIALRPGVSPVPY